MVFYKADGRFGNQLFQYSFLKTIANKNELIFTMGFDECAGVFESIEIINAEKKNNILGKVYYKLLNKVFYPLLKFFAGYKIISSIKIDHEIVNEVHKRECKSFTKTKGLISRIRFVYGGFFQSESFFDCGATSSLVIKKEFVKRANDILLDCPKESHKVFVHIRRGDYVNHTVLGKPSLLPIEYFQKAIQIMENERKDNYYIFLSDDPDYIQKAFSNIDNKILSINESFGTDLALMTNCNSGILSPSSFSWWGSYLMKNRTTVYCPKYWLGFNSNIEYQKGCPASYMTEIDVEALVDEMV
ncbi:MAG: alpha-1,2-fucosyltransferase [Fibrobacterales bacterium]